MRVAVFPGMSFPGEFRQEWYVWLRLVSAWKMWHGFAWLGKVWQDRFGRFGCVRLVADRSGELRQASLGRVSHCAVSQGMSECVLAGTNDKGKGGKYGGISVCRKKI